MTTKEAYDTILKEYPDVMNIDEMSKALGVSTKTGYKLIRDGKIQAMKVGRTYRIPKLYLLKFFKMTDSDKAC